MRKLLFTLAMALLGGLLLSGCGSDPLDYDTAMELLKDKNTEPVKLTFSAAIPPGNDIRLSAAYGQLIDAHVLACTENPAMGEICRPGPSGDAISQAGSAELSFAAGRWVPATILKISRSGGGAAVADVRMTFEPTPMYRDFQAAFDQIQTLTGRGVVSRGDGKVMRASFQRYDDGWHLDSID